MLETLEVPKVCSLTSPELDTATMVILIEKRYDIADAFQPSIWKANEINVLVGSDAYCKVATGMVHRINGDLTAVETILGCTVQRRIASPACTFSSAMFLSFEISAHVKDPQVVKINPEP